jgi:hypothetical protein
MMPSFTAVVRVTGSAGRFEEFGERVRWMMVRDPDTEPYTEHHAGGLLEYRFELTKGLPFPVFVAASGEFPELRVEVEWDKDGAKGGVTIEGGRVVDKWTGARSPA